jgi:hypothetical protein
LVLSLCQTKRSNLSLIALGPASVPATGNAYGQKKEEKETSQEES